MHLFLFIEMFGLFFPNMFGDPYPQCHTNTFTSLYVGHVTTNALVAELVVHRQFTLEGSFLHLTRRSPTLAPTEEQGRGLGHKFVYGAFPAYHCACAITTWVTDGQADPWRDLPGIPGR